MTISVQEAQLPQIKSASAKPTPCLSRLAKFTEHIRQMLMDVVSTLVTLSAQKASDIRGR